MKKSKSIALTTIIGLSLFAIKPVFAKGESKERSGSRDSGHHDNIDSGKDFGQHVSDVNDRFSGDHNPGNHHNGYSGIKK